MVPGAWISVNENVLFLEHRWEEETSFGALLVEKENKDPEIRLPLWI
jgi:hypothetical protein